jgi:hypothetical protein
VQKAVIAVAQWATGRHLNQRVIFWTRQGASVVAAALSLVALLSIWFDDPAATHNQSWLLRCLHLPTLHVRHEAGDEPGASVQVTVLAAFEVCFVVPAGQDRC